MNEFSAWLDGAGARVFALCATLFVVMNAGAVALIFVKRDRGIVNRWTARWVAANLALLGAGLGVPVAAKVVRLTVDALSVSRTLTPPSGHDAEAAEATVAPPRR
jgi:hypothetical protein